MAFGLRLFILTSLLLASMFPKPSLADLPQPGSAAPAFSLPDADGKMRKLSDWRGQWVVLYFYPRDNTPGCTVEAKNFRDSLAAFAALHAQVVGISLDDGESHRAFAEKQSLPFPLLSDPGGTVAERYGSLSNMFVIKLAKRQTYLIDPDGRIAKVYMKVDPAEHAEELLADIRRLATR
jgi:peroxiredoxin Q/BCP